MSAAMNGIALHGGLIPYGGTFLCFSDYCRPSIRLASLMQIRTIFVMTHDSIGLGEDGPTHQPVEQLAALRAIPHLAVYRPGDPVETAECWESILDTPRQTTLLALSRQPMPLLRRDPGNENRSAKGGYILLEAEGGERKLTILSTGSELHLAVEARDILQREGIPTAVISMPVRLLFARSGSLARRARESRWKRQSNSVGSAISASKAASSACTASAPPERSPTSTRSSTSTPRRWCEPHMRRWRMLPLCDRGIPSDLVATGVDPCFMAGPSAQSREILSRLG